MSTPSSSLLQGAAINLAGKIVLVIAGLLITFIVARLGAQVQGAFSLFAACEAVMLALFSGLGLALAREVSHHGNDPAEALSAMLVACLALGAVAAVAALAVAAVASQEPYRHLWLLAAGAPFLLFLPTASSLWMGQGRMLPLNVAQGAAPVAVLSLLVAGTVLRPHLTLLSSVAVVTCVLWAWVLGKSVVGVATAWFAFHDAGRAPPHWYVLRRELRFVGVIGVTNVISLLNYRASLFIIGHFCGLAQAGVYSVAVQVGELLWLLSSAVTVSAYHRIGAPDTAQAAAMTVRAVRINIVATVLAAPVLLSLAWWALPAILGSVYAQARQPLAYLLPGIASYAAASSLSAFYTNHLGRPHLSATVAGLSLALNVLGSWWAVPRYGVNAAAVSTSVAYVLAIVLATALFLRHAGLGWSAWWRVSWRDNTAGAAGSGRPAG